MHFLPASNPQVMRAASAPLRGSVLNCIPYPGGSICRQLKVVHGKWSPLKTPAAVVGVPGSHSLSPTPSKSESRPSGLRRALCPVNSPFSPNKPVRELAVTRGMGGASGDKAFLAREPSALPLGPAPSGNKVKVALCQLSVTEDKEANIKHARKAIERAADEGAQLVVLPEMWNCPYSNASFPVYAEEIEKDSPSSAMLSSVAREKGVTIVGGSIPERVGDCLYNTCLVYDKDGQLKAKHRKVHLFDIDIPGKITFKESDTLTPGDTLTVADTGVGRIGVGICYDIRFPELAMLYAAKGVHIICYPGAFNMTTGPLHWELLSRARAVDNQLFVVTCSPARDTGASYHAWGHSTVVGPFGEVLATTEHEEATVFADLDYSLLEERRRNMPLDQQRRGDLYGLVSRSA